MKTLTLNEILNTEHEGDESYIDAREVKEEIKRIKEVARKTLWKWAWWKDGSQWVGSCGTSYESAMKVLEEELKGGR